MINAVVIGAGGYGGRELVSILLRHPSARPVGLFASSQRAGSGAGETAESLGTIHPRLRGRTDLAVRPIDLGEVAALKPQVAFLATPHEASHELAPALLERGIVVIDLSAAYRLKDAALYTKHYAFEHKHTGLLEQAVYGIPELNRRQIAKANLIAAAGCYPTSAILPLAPLVKAGAIDRARRPIIDSTSGVSGAGRTATAKTHLCELSLQAYGVFSHRHNPEIDEYAGVPTVFTPHLGAFERGILSTIHAELTPGWNGARVRDTLVKAYEGEAFVRVLPKGEWPSIAAVRETNFCDIGLAVDEQTGHLIASSAIDNLVKGAAGQAAQCMNIRFGFAEEAGLPT